MAHNAFIRGGTASGLWPNGFVPTPAIWETFDQRQFESINGDQGGTWAPLIPIIIGGQGLEVAGAFRADASATFVSGLASNAASLFTSTVTFQGNCNFGGTGTTTFANGFVSTGGATFTTGSVSFGAGAPAVFNGTATFNASATFAAGLASNAASLFTSTTTFQGLATYTAGITVSAGTVNLNSTTQIGGFLNVNAVLNLLGGAHIVYKDIVSTGLDTTRGISITADGDFIRPPAITANRIWTIADAPVGSWIKISLILTSGVNTVELRRSDASTITTMKNAASFPSAAFLVFKGGGDGWVLFDSTVGVQAT